MCRELDSSLLSTLHHLHHLPDLELSSPSALDPQDISSRCHPTRTVRLPHTISLTSILMHTLPEFEER